MKHFLLTLFVAATALCSRANIVAEADSAYMADDFLTAASLYQAAIDSLGPSAERYYNLGNAYYRAGQLGKSIVNYERALRLQPTNDDIRENLEFVNSRTIDNITPQTSFVGDAVDEFALRLHPDSWAWIGLITFALALAGGCVWFFASGVAIRKVGFFGAGIMLVLAVLANIMAFRSANKVSAENEAVVVSPSVILSTTPRQPKDRSEEALLLHEGTKVTILDSINSGNGTWFDVKIDGNHRAWISAEAIEII